MSVTERTMQLGRQLRQNVRALSDDQVVELTRAWVEAWDELAPELMTSFEQLAATYPDGVTAARLNRDQRVTNAVAQVRERLETLAPEAAGSITAAMPEVAEVTVAHQLEVWRSQLPAGWTQPSASAVGAQFQAVSVAALDAVVSRATSRVQAATQPLGEEAEQALRRNLIRGIAEGENPRAVARRMVRETEGAFNGGLARATRIARTEIQDVYRESARVNRQANSDVLQGWTWTANLDATTCISCVAMHGEVFPLDEFGPQDHPNGRCYASEKLKPWSELGIEGTEPDDVPMVDARDWFDNLTEETQRQMLGPTRYDRWAAGDLDLRDMAQRVENPDWRAYYRETPVSQL